MQQSDTATTAYGILTHNGQLVACDAVLRSWLDERTVADLVPDYDKLLFTDTSEVTVIFGEASKALASVTFTDIAGDLGTLLLMRIDLLPSVVDLYRDAVTNLLDRRALEWQRRQWRAEYRSENIPHALLFMDLVGFKQINDQHGHALGDKVLQSLAERWQRSLRHGDIIVRYGGDEFVVLLRGVDSAESAKPIIKRLQKATEQRLPLDAQSLKVAVTIGLALAGNLSVSIEALLAQADRAMYTAKREG